MKLAIIGSNEVAIRVAKQFDSLGAALTLFYTPKADQSSKYKQLLNSYSDLDSVDDFNLEVEIEHIRKKHLVRPNELLRVQKRYLTKNEIISGHTRMHDLFRIVYLMNPQNVLNEQKESSPEVFENLDETTLDSLSKTMEGYEDFDLVIDCTILNGVSNWLGASGPAIGETTLKEHTDLKYGVDALESLPEIKDREAFFEVGIIGSGKLAAILLIELEQKIINNQIRAFIITTEENPFDELKSEGHLLLNKKLADSLNLIESEFEKKINKFKAKLTEWDEHEDYVKAKIPRPTEPIPAVVYFAAHSVTGIDRMVDRNRFFLTCEAPEFRSSGVQKENNQIELKTIGIDYCLVATGNQADESLYQYIQSSFQDNAKSTSIDGHTHRETGFYTLKSAESFPLSEQLDSITANIMKFFSPS
jgi:hypothetical protein